MISHSHTAEPRIQIPDWMGETAHPIRGNNHLKGSKNTFLRRSIHELKKSLSELLLTEHYSRQTGLLQQLDSSVKLLGTLALILVTGWTRNLPVLLVLWLLTLVLMRSSRLPVLALQKRIWGIFPLISLLIAVPGMFNVFNAGTPLWIMAEFAAAPHLWGIDLPSSIYISQQGATAGLTLFLRVGISISLGGLLTLTTPAAALMKSLQTLKVPSLFIMILEMSVRYLTLLLTVSTEMYEARQIRTVGKLSLHTQRAMVGSSVGALFARSMALSEEIYQAMTARGYTGEPVYWNSKQSIRTNMISREDI